MKMIFGVSLFATAVLVVAHASVAQAQCSAHVSVRFIESAPRDFFEIRNISTDQSVSSLKLNLKTSAGSLIFDTAAGGTGVEVYQPFRSEKSEARLRQAPVVLDGAEQILLRFDGFDAGLSYRFSVDVDDRLPASQLGQIRVAGSEMAGAKVEATVLSSGGRLRGVFDTNNQALLTPACGS